MPRKPQMYRRLAQQPIQAGNVVTLNIPNAHIMGALEIILDATVSDSGAAAITVVDATLGAIPIIRRAQLRLDGATVPLSVRGVFLDYWSHIDRPGSERLAESSTTSGDPWRCALRWELAQSEVNLTGAIKLSDYGTVQLEIEFGDVSAIATSANVTSIAGNVEAWGELYAEDVPVAFDNSVMHVLSEFTVDIQASGQRIIDIPRGRALERMLVVAEDNGAFTWDLLDDLTFQAGQGVEPYFLTTTANRARNRRNYGGDDMPTDGLYVFDLRRAGNRDVIPLGDPQAAPFPRLLLDVSSAAALTNAQVHVIREELEAVDRLAA